MNNGFLLYANGKQYIQQACICAMSLKAVNPKNSVSIVTNDQISEEYVNLFYKIIEVPWHDFDDSRYQILNRWKLYHASPYENTIVFDTDVIVLNDISEWWNFFNNYDLYFLSKVFTYRNIEITDLTYRKAFVANNLPNLYSGLHFFKKNDNSKMFFKWVELVSQNWELFYGQYCKEYYPKTPSMDIIFSIVAKILNLETKITNSKINFLHFVHIKSKLQDWIYGRDSWQDKVGVYFTQDLKLFIANYLQTGVFHYTEDTFISSNNIVENYKEFLRIKL